MGGLPIMVKAQPWVWPEVWCGCQCLIAQVPQGAWPEVSGVPCGLGMCEATGALKNPKKV